MIRTDKQYNSALKKIDSLKYAINNLRVKNLLAHERNAKTSEINLQIENLTKLSDDYKTCKLSNPYDIKINSLDDLMKTPIKYRIASGMSQDTFSKHVSVSTRQIERYEKENYQNITLSTFKKIFSALNIEVTGKVLS